MLGKRVISKVNDMRAIDKRSLVVTFCLDPTWPGQFMELWRHTITRLVDIETLGRVVLDQCNILDVSLG